MPRHLRHALIAGTALAAACHGAPPSRPATPIGGLEQPPPELALIPRPDAITARCADPVIVDRSTRIAGPKDVAEQLAAWLGLPASAPTATADIELVLENHDPRSVLDGPVGIDEERYVLELTPPRHARVTARGRSGLLYGAQAIAQLAGARRIAMGPTTLGTNERWTLPCVRIEDDPRYAFRALHLDVARHFFDRTVVERYVDLLAFYRFNVFHWHLTDDQGFRLRLTSHPELASADGAYGSEDVKAVVAYAAARGVTVIPEIEMPGHTRSVLAAHPELSCTGAKQPTPRTWGIFDDVLCAGNEGSYALVRDVLTEVASLFPSRYLHVGGDEVPPTRWDACPKCRAAMAKEHVDAAGLEHVFMERVFDMLGTLNRRPLVWDEALPPRPGKNPPIVVAWQSHERGRLAAERGFDTVFAPYEWVYLNFTNSPFRGIEPGHQGVHRSWSKLHAFEFGDGPHIRGGEGALWTEFVTTQADIDTLIAPRAAALAEALWSGPRPDHEFVTRFKLQRPMLDASGIDYFIDPPAGARPRSVLVDETWVTLQQPPLFPDGVIRYTRDGSVPTPASPRYRDPLSITETMTLTTALFLPNGRASSPIRAAFVKETPRPALDPHATKATTVAYHEGAFHKLEDIKDAVTIAQAQADAIDLGAAARALGDRMKADHFALVFEGTFRVPATGVHRFEIRGDDGLRVEVDGENIVEIDGELGARDADGEIALAAGLHRVRVTYFQGTEGKELAVAVVGPGGRTRLEN